MKNLTFYVFILFTSNVLAQYNVTNNWQRAQISFEKRNYADAITYFEKSNTLILSDSTKACEYYRKMAIANENLNLEEKAIEFYTSMIKNCVTDAKDLYQYGLLLMQNGAYEKAKKVFTVFKNQQEQNELADWAIQSCDSALAWQISPYYFTQNVSNINSKFDEMGSQITDNKLIFSSSRENTIIRKKSGLNNQPSFKIYETSRLETLKHKPKPSHIFQYNTLQPTQVAFNADFNEVYFTEINPQTGLLQIFKSTKQEGKFSTKEAFVYNNDSASFAHPYVSTDGNTLYFVSDMKGGFGGTDIYMCSKKNGKWTTPTNLGQNVNTTDNEIFPYLYDGKTLYFSSNGRVGMGGYDLYKSLYLNGIWTNTENLKYPINSSKDDITIIFETSTTGYLSSNRKQGLGGFDIYLFGKR